MVFLDMYRKVSLPSVATSQSSCISFTIDLVVGPDLLVVGLGLGLVLGPLLVVVYVLMTWRSS